MAKRVALKANAPSAMKAAVEAHNNPDGPVVNRGNRTTGINLPVEEWELLLDVANARKKQRGGRASVSAILLDLIQRHKAELEAELRA